MEELSNAQKSHKLCLIGRKTCQIGGVLDVISFDLATVLLETELGMLTIKGNDLHVNRLSLEKGEIDVEGRIDSLTYTDTASYGSKGEGFISRLFR